MRTTTEPPIPKYWQLAEHFRQQLADGVLKPGDRLPSLAEMQSEHNASRPTVERAHALLEKEGLIIRRHGAGVFVSHPVAKSTHGVLGLSGEGFAFKGNSSYWATLMRGIREAASSAGQQLLILDDSLQGWEKADGVIICDWNSNKAAVNHPLGQPIVSILVAVEGMSSITADDYNGSRQATQHLLDLGHQRIGFLHAFGEQPILTRRLAGYHDALKTAGIIPLPEWEANIEDWFSYGDQIVQAARESMTKWIKNGWSELGCTALLCHNDETALGAIQAFQSAGIDVPGEVSVVGFDGTDFGLHTTPALTSVELPLQDIGALAVKSLLEQIRTDSVGAEHQELPMHLKVRESTARNKEETVRSVH